MIKKKEKILELINLFTSNIKQYKSTNYDEANTRVDFIDKFFEILDWDVRNVQGFQNNIEKLFVKIKSPQPPLLKGE